MVTPEGQPVVVRLVSAVGLFSSPDEVVQRVHAHLKTENLFEPIHPQ